MGEEDFVLKEIKKNFQRYSGQIFECVVTDFIKENRNIIPMQFTRIGSWWSAGEEIDIVAINENTKEILFGEVKYTKKRVGLNTLNALLEKAKKVKWGTDSRLEHYMIISMSGFENDIMDKDVTLIDMNTLERITSNVAL